MSQPEQVTGKVTGGAASGQLKGPREGMGEWGINTEVGG